MRIKKPQCKNDTTTGRIAADPSAYRAITVLVAVVAWTVAQIQR